jgi:hypothetical protein
MHFSAEGPLNHSHPFSLDNSSQNAEEIIICEGEEGGIAGGMNGNGKEEWMDRGGDEVAEIQMRRIRRLAGAQQLMGLALAGGSGGKSPASGTGTADGNGGRGGRTKPRPCKE